MCRSDRPWKIIDINGSSDDHHLLWMIQRKEMGGSIWYFVIISGEGIQDHLKETQRHREPTERQQRGHEEATKRPWRGHRLWHREAETQRHTDTETTSRQDTETQRHRDTEAQRHRRNEQTQRHSLCHTETKIHRYKATQRRKDTQYCWLPFPQCFADVLK